MQVYVKSNAAAGALVSDTGGHTQRGSPVVTKGWCAQRDEGTHRYGVRQHTAEKTPLAVGHSGPWLVCTMNVNRETGKGCEDLVVIQDIHHSFVRQNVCD